MRAFWATAMWLLEAPLAGTERWYLVTAFDALVMGRLERMWRIPCFDGWHLWSRVRVDRVLKGDVKNGALLEHRFLCAAFETVTMWNLHSDWRAQSVWYLKRIPGGGWTSPGNPDFGQRPISEVSDLLKVLGR